MIKKILVIILLAAVLAYFLGVVINGLEWNPSKWEPIRLPAEDEPSEVQTTFIKISNEVMTWIKFIQTNILKLG